MPKEISDFLGCQPKLSAKAGDIDPRHKDKTRIVKEGFWLLSSEDNDESILEMKIQMLLSKLTDDLVVWKQITSNFRVDMFCGLFLNDFNEGFSINPELSRKLSERNITIGFDIYSGCD